MSKIGRKHIILSSATVTINGKKIAVSGPKAKFEHELPDGIEAKLEDKNLILSISEDTRQNRMNWGMHRALLANKVKGAEIGFEVKMKIVGLGYKAQATGKKIVFSLGYSHKINFDLPEGVEFASDKTGQNLVFKCTNNILLGEVCATVRAFRPPEPYKGTGIMREGEVIIRKAGKAKSA